MTHSLVQESRKGKAEEEPRWVGSPAGRASELSTWLCSESRGRPAPASQAPIKAHVGMMPPEELILVREVSINWLPACLPKLPTVLWPSLSPEERGGGCRWS